MTPDPAAGFAGKPAPIDMRKVPSAFPPQPVPDPNRRLDDLMTGVRLAQPLVKPWFVLVALARTVYVVTWTLFAIGAVWLGWQALDRRPAVAYRDVHVETPFVYPGGELKVFYAYRRDRVCESDVTYTLFDGANEARRFGPVHADAVGSLGEEAYVRAWPIPASVAPGHGRLRMVLAWQCPGNYLQAIYPVTAVLPEQSFTILPHGP